MTNHFLILCLMKGAATADQKVWERTQRDIERIAIDALHAIDNVLSSGSNDIKFTLSVIATVVSITAIPLTAGASAVVAGLGAVGSAAGTAAQLPQYVSGSGGSPESIVQAMEDAIEKLTSQIRDKQSEIAKMLYAYVGEVSQGKGDPPTPYLLKRPNLAGMEGKELITSEGIGTPKWGIG